MVSDLLMYGMEGTSLATLIWLGYLVRFLVARTDQLEKDLLTLRDQVASVFHLLQSRAIG